MARQYRQGRDVRRLAARLLRDCWDDPTPIRRQWPWLRAPVTDYYMGDDSYHNGAFMLAHRFNFYQGFRLREGDPAPPPARFQFGMPDGYDFQLETNFANGPASCQAACFLAQFPPDPAVSTMMP